MPAVYMLINAETDSEHEVLKILLGDPSVDDYGVKGHVKEAYQVYGVYDIVARVEAETMDKLKEVVTWGIRRLPHVRSTLTMIVVEGFNKGEMGNAIDGLPSSRGAKYKTKS